MDETEAGSRSHGLLAQAMSLAGRVAVITGGASGMGLATARLMSEAGASVVILDRDAEGSAAAAAELGRGGGGALAVPTDVSQERQVEAAIARTVQRFGRVDVLFNNAGVGLPSAARRIVDTTEEQWDGVIAVNLKGVAMCCKHVLPLMAEAARGVVINNASISGLVATVASDAYTAAKGGVVALTRALAVDWTPRGIRVHCVCPGTVETPMVAHRDDSARERERAFSVIGRVAQPEEIACVVTFLATDAASFMSGAVVPVDGGWTAR